MVPGFGVAAAAHATHFLPSPQMSEGAASDGTEKPPPMPSLDDLMATQNSLLAKPYYGLNLGKGIADHIKRHVAFSHVLENKWHPDGNVRYDALKSVSLKCKHCKKSIMNVNATVETCTLKAFNSSRAIEHLYSCPSMSVEEQGPVLEYGCSKNSAAAKAQTAKLARDKEIKKREHSASAAEGESPEKQAKLARQAQAEADRQRLVTVWASHDTAMTTEMFNVAMWYLSVFIFMCRIPFAIIDNIYFRKVCVLFMFLGLCILPFPGNHWCPFLANAPICVSRPLCHIVCLVSDC